MKGKEKGFCLFKYSSHWYIIIVVKCTFFSIWSRCDRWEPCCAAAPSRWGASSDSAAVSPGRLPPDPGLQRVPRPLEPEGTQCSGPRALAALPAGPGPKAGGQSGAGPDPVGLGQG